MKLFELFATLELQANKFNDGINKAQGVAQNFAGKVQSAVSAGTVALGNLMARGVEVAANAVKNIGSQALNLTGQLEQNVGGSLAVFGTWAETVQEKSAKAFETMGLSATDYLATANQMGSLFKGAGFTTAEAMELTTEAMQRAADVASIMGIDAAWAMESVAGAAKGNFTMMDNLGVAINETTLANYALEKGLKKSTAAMTTQEKVGLAMEMFLERTAEYAGNYAKENDTLAGAMQTAKAAWDNLLSGVEDFSGADFVDAIENLFRVVTRNVAKIVPRLTSSFTEIAQRAIPKIKTAFTSFWNNDLPGIATQGVNLVINGINQLFGTDIKPIEVIDLPTVEEITGKLKALWDGVTEATSGLFTWTLGLFTPPDESIDHMGSLAAWWYGTALPFIKETFNWTIGIFQPPGDGVDPDGYIAQWWEYTALPFLDATCKWTLSMFLPPDENGDITPESVITGWWENVAGVVSGACQWTLNLFSGVAGTDADGNEPQTIIANWWSTIIESIVSACEWTLGIFQQPVETVDDVVGVVSSWWSGVVGAVESACVWFLSMFKAPQAAEDGKGPGAIMATWWNGVVDTVISACAWTLGLFTGVNGVTDANGNATTPQAIVEGWWETVVDSVRSACQWTLGLFNPPTEDVDADGSFSTWWANTAAPALRDICTWTIGLFMPPSDEDIDGSGAIYAWWYNTAMPALDNICQWTISLFGPPTEDIADDGLFSKWWEETALPAIQSICTWTLGLFNPPTEDGDAAGTQITTWWNNVAMPAIESACVWTLGLFNVPAESAAKVASVVGGWWLNNVKLVELVCGWTLRLFDDPKETPQVIKAIVSQWWEGVSASVEAACTWVLQLFGLPTETTDQIKAKVSGWWSTVVGGVQETCQFVAHLTGFDLPAEGDISTWWNGVKGKIETTISNLGGIAVNVSKLIFTADPIIDISSIASNVSSFAADMTGVLKGVSGNNDLMELLKTGGIAAGAAALLNSHPLIAGITLVIANWDTLKLLVENTGEAIDEFFNKTIPEGWNTFVDGIKSKWGEVKSVVDESIIRVKDFLGLSSEASAVHLGENGEYGGASGERFDVVSEPSAQSSDSPGGGASGKKFAVGLNYVPYNDFPTLLHEGEAVLTKAEATAWRRGETTGNVSIDYDRLGSIVAAAVAEAVTGIAIQMDKQTVGTIVSPVVFREMGRQLGNKRFAT